MLNLHLIEVNLKIDVDRSSVNKNNCKANQMSAVRQDTKLYFYGTSISYKDLLGQLSDCSIAYRKLMVQLRKFYKAILLTFNKLV